MTKGFLATLFAGVVAFGAITPAFAAAPVISGLPDVAVGDTEDAGVGGSDTNVFQFSNAFKFSDFVSDTDTPAGSLMWSFGEYDSPAGLPTPEYSVNGKAPINVGTDAIVDDETAGSPNAKAPGANQLNSGANDYASFRDILFSPGTGLSYPDPATTESAAASEGKFLRFYVSDPDGNVTSQTVIVSSLDGGFDSLTESDGFQTIFTDSDLSSPDWVKSGIDSGPEDAFDTSSPDDVNATKGAGVLNSVVHASTTGRTRILGWQNPGVANYDDVGAGNYLHGKFYIYTSNATSDANNQVPGFRVRLQNEGAVDAQNEYAIGQTGLGNVPQDPTYDAFNNPAADTRVATYLRPSNDSTKPSVYAVDFDPIDVPNAVGTTIWATMESYATANPAEATLSLTQVDVATYRAKTDAEGTLIWAYDRSNENAVGGTKRLSSGSFNAEADFQYGRRQILELPAGDGSNLGELATITTSSQGILIDTLQTPADKFGAGIATLDSPDPLQRPRIEPNKLYRAKFYVTSDVPTTSEDSNATIQGNMRVYVQTGIGVVNSYLEIVGAQNASAPDNATKKIAVQALPGTGSANPDTSATLDTANEHGGWYSVILSSPLNAGGIRADNGDNFGSFGSDPGPGVAGDSAKDMVLGLNALEQPSDLQIAPPPAAKTPFAQPNEAKFRISKIELYEYPAIDESPSNM